MTCFLAAIVSGTPFTVTATLFATAEWNKILVACVGVQRIICVCAIACSKKDAYEDDLLPVKRLIMEGIQAV